MEAERVARLLAAHFDVPGGRETVERAPVNDYTRSSSGWTGEIESVLAVRIDNRRVTGRDVVRNPDKLPPRSA